MAISDIGLNKERIVKVSQSLRQVLLLVEKREFSCRQLKHDADQVEERQQLKAQKLLEVGHWLPLLMLRGLGFLV